MFARRDGIRLTFGGFLHDVPGVINLPEVNSMTRDTSGVRSMSWWTSGAIWFTGHPLFRNIMETCGT